jgi:hypothetical protein
MGLYTQEVAQQTNVSRPWGTLRNEECQAATVSQAQQEGQKVNVEVGKLCMTVHDTTNCGICSGTYPGMYQNMVVKDLVTCFCVFVRGIYQCTAMNQWLGRMLCWRVLKDMVI